MVGGGLAQVGGKVFVDRANVASEYTYDANGNMTKDLNKSITSISYNSLNLPGVVSFTDGNSITYGYDAAGGKLSAAYKSGANVAKTEYAGNKVYKNGTLSMILTEEGYVTLSGTTPAYHYFLKDHQGNNRVVVSQTGAVEQVSHHYPFGGLFGEGTQTSNQPYRYNGKELDRQFGLDLYDYGARHYDAAIGRWGTPDPLGEKYFGLSPYVYCGNNPILYVDPDGREPRLYVETKGFGHVFVTAGTGDNTVVYTYGRYGELGKDKSSARGTTPTGEGVLIRLTGNDAKVYIQDQITKNEAITFEFTKGSDDAVMKHFDNIFNSSDKMPTTGKYADNENARVIDTYNLFNNNCVTVSIDGVQSGSKENLKLGGLKGPMAIRDVLNAQSGRKESNVIKITPEEIKKELKLPNE